MKPDPYEDYAALQSFVDESEEPTPSASRAEIVDPLPLQSFVDEGEAPSLRVELKRESRDAIKNEDAAVVRAADVVVTLGGSVALAVLLRRLFVKRLEGADAARALREIADVFEGKRSRDS